MFCCLLFVYWYCWLICLRMFVLFDWLRVCFVGLFNGFVAIFALWRLFVFVLVAICLFLFVASLVFAYNDVALLSVGVFYCVMFILWCLFRVLVVWFCLVALFWCSVLFVGLLLVWVTSVCVYLLFSWFVVWFVVCCLCWFVVLCIV